MWWLWVAGTVVLAGAGFAATAVPRLRLRASSRRTAWSAAHAAIASAGVSRDACRDAVPEAAQLLARAEGIAAGRGGDSAATEAAELARRADRVWRAAA